MRNSICIVGFAIFAVSLNSMELALVKPELVVSAEEAQAKESFQQGEAFFKGFGREIDYGKASSFFESAADQNVDLEINLRALLRLALICALEKNNERMSYYVNKLDDLVQQSKRMSEEEFKEVALFLWLMTQPTFERALVGKYYLCAAVWSGLSFMVELALDSGVNICEKVIAIDIPEPFDNVRSDLIYKKSYCHEVTPLHVAAVKGHATIVRLLLARGGDINTRGDHGVTALHLAAHEGHHAVVEVLLDSGAYVNSRDILDFTPLHFATRYEHKKIVRALILQGASLNAEDEKGLTPLYFPIGEEPDLALEELLSSGVGITEPWSSLLIASFQGDKEKVELLIDQQGVDVNEFTDGFTPLFGALRNGHNEIATRLLDRGADVNSQWLYGLTPLVVAVEGGYKDLVILLINRGALVTMHSQKVTTPLQCAVQWPCYMSIVKYFISCGFKPYDIHKFVGLHVLQLASLKGFNELVKVFEGTGLDVNAADGDNSTPLHKAARFGHDDVVRVLMGQGANILLEDSCAQTPLHRANHYKRGKTCAVLLSHALTLPKLRRVTFEIDCEKMQLEGLELLSPLISPADYIRIVFFCFDRLGIPRDLHIVILSKDVGFVEIMSSAVMFRLKNGIARGRLAEYVKRTPAFLKPIVIERLYAVTMSQLKELMLKVASDNGYYQDVEMTAVFDIERLEGQFGQDLKRNLQYALGFNYEKIA